MLLNQAEAAGLNPAMVWVRLPPRALRRFEISDLRFQIRDSTMGMNAKGRAGSLSSCLLAGSSPAIPAFFMWTVAQLAARYTVNVVICGFESRQSTSTEG